MKRVVWAFICASFLNFSQSSFAEFILLQPDLPERRSLTDVVERDSYIEAFRQNCIKVKSREELRKCVGSHLKGYTYKTSIQWVPPLVWESFEELEGPFEGETANQNWVNRSRKFLTLAKTLGLHFQPSASSEINYTPFFNHYLESNPKNDLGIDSGSLSSILNKISDFQIQLFEQQDKALGSERFKEICFQVLNGKWIVNEDLLRSGDGQIEENIFALLGDVKKDSWGRQLCAGIAFLPKGLNSSSSSIPLGSATRKDKGLIDKIKKRVRKYHAFLQEPTTRFLYVRASEIDLKPSEERKIEEKIRSSAELLNAHLQACVDENNMDQFSQEVDGSHFAVITRDQILNILGVNEDSKSHAPPLPPSSFSVSSLDLVKSPRSRSGSKSGSTPRLSRSKSDDVQISRRMSSKSSSHTPRIGGSSHVKNSSPAEGNSDSGSRSSSPRVKSGSKSVSRGSTPRKDSGLSVETKAEHSLGSRLESSGKSKASPRHHHSSSHGGSHGGHSGHSGHSGRSNNSSQTLDKSQKAKKDELG